MACLDINKLKIHFYNEDQLKNRSPLNLTKLLEKIKKFESVKIEIDFTGMYYMKILLLVIY